MPNTRDYETSAEFWERHNAAEMARRAAATTMEEMFAVPMAPQWYADASRISVATARKHVASWVAAGRLFDAGSVPSERGPNRKIYCSSAEVAEKTKTKAAETERYHVKFDREFKRWKRTGEHPADPGYVPLPTPPTPAKSRPPRAPKGVFLVSAPVDLIQAVKERAEHDRISISEGWRRAAQAWVDEPMDRSTTSDLSSYLKAEREGPEGYPF